MIWRPYNGFIPNWINSSCRIKELQMSTMTFSLYNKQINCDTHSKVTVAKVDVGKLSTDSKKKIIIRTLPCQKLKRTDADLNFEHSLQTGVIQVSNWLISHFSCILPLPPVQFVSIQLLVGF